MEGPLPSCQVPENSSVSSTSLSDLSANNNSLALPCSWLSLFFLPRICDLDGVFSSFAIFYEGKNDSDVMSEIGTAKAFALTRRI